MQEPSNILHINYLNNLSTIFSAAARKETKNYRQSTFKNAADRPKEKVL